MKVEGSPTYSLTRKVATELSHLHPTRVSPKQTEATQGLASTKHFPHTRHAYRAIFHFQSMLTNFIL